MTTTTERFRHAAAASAVAALLLTAACSTPLVGTAAPSAAGAAVADEPTSAVEATYGVKIDGLRLSAAGSMLDFRYRVVDPVKAAPLLNGRVQPYLLDDAHEAKLAVPDTPVLGRMRQTSRNNKILTDHTYFILFGNPGKAVKSGDKVTLLLGSLRISDLQVQ